MISNRDMSTRKKPRLKKSNEHKRMLQPLVLVAKDVPPEITVILMFNGVTFSDRMRYLDTSEKTDKILPDNLKNAVYTAQRNNVHKWYYKEMRLRYVFRIFARLWLYKRYSGKLLNTDDPGTLQTPRKEVRVFCPKSRGSYCFEATTLLRTIERDLGYSEAMFPEPRQPCNPLTNLPFHIGQYLHILQALRNLGYGSWMMESYLKCSMNLSTFRDVNTIGLKLRALQEIVRNPWDKDSIDLLGEFIEDQYYYHEIIHKNHLNILRWAVRNAATDPYIVEWRITFKNYISYKIKYGLDEYTMNESMHYIIHAMIAELFRKHSEIGRLGRLRIISLQKNKKSKATQTIVQATGQTVAEVPAQEPVQEVGIENLITSIAVIQEPETTTEVVTSETPVATTESTPPPTPALQPVSGGDTPPIEQPPTEGEIRQLISAFEYITTAHSEIMHQRIERETEVIVFTQRIARLLEDIHELYTEEQEEN